MKINRMVSLVVPVYNEEDNLRHFYRSVRDVMDKLPYHWELIFVDDGSSDSSRTMLAEMEVQDERVRAIFLARNYGHQTALTCGLDHADGEAVISMDGDMQHPPELLPRLLELWEQGFDVVQAIRKATADAGFMKRLTSAGYYRLLNMITSVPIREGGSDFRLRSGHRREAAGAALPASASMPASCGDLYLLLASVRRYLNLQHRLDLPVIPSILCEKCCGWRWTECLPARRFPCGWAYTPA